MITYVLILVLAGHAGETVGVTEVYFENKKSCEKGAMRLQEDLGRKFDVNVVCLPQGSK